MEQQIAVDGLIQTALGVQVTGVLLELLAMAEGIRQLGDHMEFVLRQLIGIGRVHRGEVAVQHGIDLVTDGDGLILIVNLIQQQTVGTAVEMNIKVPTIEKIYNWAIQLIEKHNL